MGHRAFSYIGEKGLYIANKMTENIICILILTVFLFIPIYYYPVNRHTVVMVRTIKKNAYHWLLEKIVDRKKY